VTHAVASAPARPALLPYALASAALCGLGLAAAAHAAAARAALFGVSAAAASAAFALPALALGVPRGTSGVLAAFVAGFFGRMVAVAAGLILSGARGEAAIAYAGYFFLLFAFTQAVEVAYVWGSSRKRRTGA
jgi:hypothetical protein